MSVCQGWTGGSTVYRQIVFVPFDPVRKRAEGQIEHGGEAFTAVKGAPQVLIGLSDLPDQQAAQVQQMVEMLGVKGYRTLAVGRRRGEAPLELVGLFPLYDPPREDSARVIADMAVYDVQVKMVTGDHGAIAWEIGLNRQIRHRDVFNCSRRRWSFCLKL